MRKAMAGIRGCKNLLAARVRTKQDTLIFLQRIHRHFALSGQKDCQVFLDPQGAEHVVQKLINKVSQLWVPKRKTSVMDLQKFHRTKKRIRRVEYKDRMQVFAKSTVNVMRTALPCVYGQGFLKKPVAVHPYRPMDTFMTMHRVNVYKHANRFDVIDALCNIPILAGLSRQGLKKVVQW
jgi:hypothetical protein